LLVAAQATQFKAQADARRQRGLPKQATTQQDIDNAESALRNADAAVGEAQANVRGADIVAQSIAQADAQVHQLEAQVALAQAQLEQAELNLGWTKVRAPQDGWVTKRNVDKGNYVQVGQSVMALVTPEIWVTANFKEDQLDRMRPGQRVDIGVDAFPAVHLVGHVDSVQLGSGSRFSAFPAENATGNFVKIVQRVPVKIVIDSGLDPAHPLPLGISVDPVVRLK
jgi:membrane fusion protein (multidrug efflux system)